jgi:predicted methyltransferase
MTSSRILFTAPALAAALALACGPKGETAPPTTDPAAATTPAVADEPEPAADEAKADPAGAKLAEVLAGPQRSADNRARDAARHPAETLAFFGVKPEHTVVELWPGGGWYTEILGPYVKDEGKLIVTIFDPKGPEAYYGTGQSKKMLERLAAEKDVLGDVGTVVVPQKVTIGKDGKVSKIQIQKFQLAPAGSVDVVLTFRNSHGWFNNDVEKLIYGAAFEALKPGGVFGVVQHRAAEGADPNETSKKGYLPEASVIEAAEAVGFKLAEKSEVNANPKDTRDYPEGVWALPPSLSGGDTDRDKRVAIGESDRMTLKFIKPDATKTVP